MNRSISGFAPPHPRGCASCPSANPTRPFGADVCAMADGAADVHAGGNSI